MVNWRGNGTYVCGTYWNEKAFCLVIDWLNEGSREKVEAGQDEGGEEEKEDHVEEEDDSSDCG